MESVKLTEKQKALFKRAWFIFGNGGSKSTLFNHKLIQGFVEYSENRVDAYRKSQIQKILDGEEKFVQQYGVKGDCFRFCELVLANKLKEAEKLLK